MRLDSPRARLIGKGAELLARLTPRRTEDTLDAFKERFELRFAGREIGLLEALDPETGERVDELDRDGPLERVAPARAPRPAPGLTAAGTAALAFGDGVRARRRDRSRPDRR